MTKFEGNSTANARIKIDYRGKKPKVQFSYPDEKNQFHGSVFGYIFILCLFFGISFIYGFVTNDSLYQYSNLEKYTNCVKDNYLENYSSLRYGVCNQTVSNGFQQIKTIFMYDSYFFKQIYLAIIFFIILPCLIYFPFKKKLNKYYPKIQGFLARKKIKIFYPKDIQEYNGDIFCEIPLFNNVILNYEATEDFSKYLDFFEIREHNFKYQYKKRIRKPFAKVNKRIEKENKRRTINEWLWYAKFYFSQKPRKGKLSVLFK